MQKYRVTIIMSTSRLSLFFFYAILIFLVNNPTINAQRDPYVLHQCSTTGNVTSNSTFRANLNTLISTLSSNTQIDYGFYNFTAGEGTNKVYATGLCRADLSPTDCRSCVNMSAHELLQLCPTQKEGVMWYMNCTARYSNNSIFGVVELKPTRALVSGLVLLTKVNEALKAVLFDDLRVRASAGSIFGKVAVGIANYNIRNSTDTIYGLMQCSPDLSENDCSNCLVGAQSYFQACCSESVGVRILAPSCNLRIESEQFYDSTLGESPTSLSPPSPAKSISPPPAPAKSISPPPAPAKSISPPPLVPSKEKKSNSSKAIIIIVVAVVVFTMLIICICVSLRVKKQRKNVQMDEISSTESLHFDFPTIRVATDNFSVANKLGQGGFGVVYKGRLSNGQEIAVKRLSPGSGQGDLEFKNEILLVAKLQHRNLVKLRGFCLEGCERLLIYEFVPNGSLDQVIFDPTKRAYLDWQTRYKIIEGIARGLLYLHEDSRLRIIHRDLKTSNILLDDEMNPKIADFGMARLVILDQTHINTNRIVGTYGYMAPEYAYHGHFSVKSDVFSFGVLVLEMICGQKNGYFRNEENGEDLLTYAWTNWRNMTASNIIDPTLGVGSTTEIIRCIHIGLLCVQENAADRLTMASVVLMLNSNSITLSVPSRPAFFIHSNVEPDSQSDQSLLLASTNDASITELHPR
ncbi:cysteine-rich receptor-like protein kinase 44 isoform X1 [Quercus robur]|uniref:cysteine-rich receptor-like protein kinase 44 isoform X1 n=1 Tax=Quercus robur TaxID=38942 RepID=UPI00216389AF|nr:cysteine-rich receptor-like protein kinase 44 isoform X1 [Quercus robur]